MISLIAFDDVQNRSKTFAVILPHDSAVACVKKVKFSMCLAN
jgi:hypothetical protein